jgi:hypothetical protein
LCQLHKAHLFQPHRASRAYLIRLPEACGVAWLLLLAAAVWTHTHASQQTPVYDAFTYFEKGYRFWAGVDSGRWFNPFNVDPTFRPPGTVLMSFPFGFAPDPRGFYFRSVYLPAVLLFLSVLIAGYDTRDDIAARWRIMLLAMLFATVTVIYHFEVGAWIGDYWGLVDGFLAGLAAVAAACVWRGTKLGTRRWGWALLAGVVSAVAIAVKPTGTIVAAIVGIGWTVFSVGTLIELRSSSRLKVSNVLPLLAGAGLIGTVDLLAMAAAVNSQYLSSQNIAYGLAAIAINKAETHLPLSLLWTQINAGVGGALVSWTLLAIAAWLHGALMDGGSAIRDRCFAAMIASALVLIFGIWFWFIGSGAPNQIRYGVPFFMIGMVWLAAAAQGAWVSAPMLLNVAAFAIAVVGPLNLVFILLVQNPSLGWQKFSGVGITAAFSKPVLAAFKKLVNDDSVRPLDVYMFSFDIDDALLDSAMDMKQLLLPSNQMLAVHRPVDWVRPSTFRVDEIKNATVFLINPEQARQAPGGFVISNFRDEQGVLTAWADRLNADDGVSIFFSAPTAKILMIIDHAKLEASLERVLARYSWDNTFAAANGIR